MALGSNGKLNTPLLDTLIQLSDLVKALQGKDYLNHINELKEKTEALNQARAVTEPQIHALNDARVDNEKSASDARAALKALADEKVANEKQLRKIAADKSAVDAARAEAEKRIADAEAEIAKKSQAVAVREAKANEAIKNANAVTAEYQAKLNDLKKITG